MENVTFFDTTDQATGETETHALIAHADGSFTTMAKSTYEAQQVEHLTEIPTEQVLGYGYGTNTYRTNRRTVTQSLQNLWLFRVIIQERQTAYPCA